MALAPGQTLLHYQIVDKVGAGGMGEVWRARDTRLQREVAIKVLPPELAADEDRLQRFEREARTLAQLNHPNIAGIHGFDESDGTRFLAMELVPGEDLAARLERGPLPLADALDVCRQIAEGLEAAHEAGVVHRDLKPANVRIAPDGTAKVLDFGLAKPVQQSTSVEPSAMTASVGITSAGMVLGTPTYMSPEQARGKQVDRRADIWAFGCVLYECLVGRRTFGGETVTDVLAAILERDPNWGPLPAGTPHRVRKLLHRCLDKDPRSRLRDIGEARLVLEGRGDEEPAPTAHRSWLWPAIAALLGLALIWSATSLRGSPEDAPPTLLPLASELIAPPGQRMFALRGAPAVTRDGRHVAFVAADEATGQTAIWVRDLTGAQPARRIPGTEHGRDPFWAPDGRRLGFARGEDLLTVGVDEDRPRLLLRGFSITGASWNTDDLILFASRDEPLRTVQAQGGESEIALDHAPDHASAWAMWPAFLPDERSFVFAIQDTGGEVSGLFVGELGSSNTKRLLPEVTNAVYVEPGWLFHRRGNALYATRFDAEARELGTESIRLAKNVRLGDWPMHAVFGASRHGRTVFYPHDPGLEPSDFVWLDLEDQSTEPLGVTGILWNPRLSRDGNKLAFDRSTMRTSGDVWIRDLLRGTELQLTDAPSDDSWPVWTPDHDAVFFYMVPNLYRATASGAGEPELVLETSEGVNPVDISADGATLLLTLNRFELHQLDLASGTSSMLLDGVTDARLSPDEKWIAMSVQKSHRSLIAVQTYPEGQHFTLVAEGEAERPNWSADGNEVLYAAEGQVVAAPIRFREGAPPVVETPRVVVPRRGRRPFLLDRGYDVARDGRLLLVRGLAEDRGDLTMLENPLRHR